MDRSTTSAADDATAMRVAGASALDILLSAAGGDRGKSAAAPATRRVVPGASVLRQPAHGRHARREAEARPAADAHRRDRGHLPKAQPEPSGTGPRDLSVSAARPLDQPAQSR